MLTVIRDMAEAVAERRADFAERRLESDASEEEQNALLAEILAAALFAGERAVRQSTEQLDVLARAGVVDAGALGLVVILRGALAALVGEEAALPELPRYAPARVRDVHHTESRFRYCTNFIVIGEGLDSQAVVPRLEELGDSVLVVGDDATLKVHVHTDDPDAAKAIFDGLGRIEREDIADMHEQVAERDARLTRTRSKAVAVAGGDGIRKLFEELDVQVVDGGPTLNPSTNDLLRGIEAAPADEIVLLPNSKNVLLAAEEAARLADKPVVVVPCPTQQGALVALVEFDPDEGAAENAQRIEEILAETRVGGVAPAAKDDVEGRFARGDTVGFENDEVIAWGGVESTLRATVERLADGAEILTIIAGAEPPIPLDQLDLSQLDGTEIERYEGGQENWFWLIAAQ